MINIGKNEKNNKNNYNEKNVKYFIKLLNNGHFETKYLPTGSFGVLRNVTSKVVSIISGVEHENTWYLMYVSVNKLKDIYSHIHTRFSSIRNIVIDIDAIREKGFEKEPATDKELEDAYNNAVKPILNFFKVSSFQTPLITHTGNGYQLFCKIPSISLSDKNNEKFQNKLRLFNELLQFKINTKTKKYIKDFEELKKVMIIGTFNIEGDNTLERPHRLTKFITKEYNIDSKLKEYILNIKYEF